MRRIRRRLLQRPADRLGDLLIADLAWRSRAGLVVETIEAALGESASPHHLMLPVPRPNYLKHFRASFRQGSLPPRLRGAGQL
jgi:hypothetical protein